MCGKIKKIRSDKVCAHSHFVLAMKGKTYEDKHQLINPKILTVKAYKAQETI